jgi:hypothetical protein
MKLIFLDFDGVLNSRQSEIYYTQFHPDKKTMEDRLCPIATSNLLYILKDHPDTKIVVSSTWRRNRTEAVLGEILSRYGINPEVVISKTPYYGPGEVRGLRIQEWFDTHPEVKPTHFVIIDDDADMAHFLGTPHFIKTSTKMGLMYQEVQSILAYFGDYNLNFNQLTPGSEYRLFSKPKQVAYTFLENEIYYLDEEGVKRKVFFNPETEKFCLIKKSI